MIYRSALVTGASSGLGWALVETLASQGTHVVAAARRLERLQDLKRQVESRGGKMTPVQLDVADTSQVVNIIRQLDEQVDGLECIIANAGIGVRMSGKRMTFEGIEATLKVNYLGALASLTAVLPQMIARGKGHLVGISSLAAFRGLPGHAAYCSSKAGLSTFLEALAYDLKGTGVAVTAVHPGFIKTEMTAENRHPMPQILTPEEASRRIIDALARRPMQIDFPFAVATVSKLIASIPKELMGSLAPLLKPPKKGQPPMQGDAT